MGVGVFFFFLIAQTILCVGGLWEFYPVGGGGVSELELLDFSIPAQPEIVVPVEARQWLRR